MTQTPIPASKHYQYMREALAYAEVSLKRNEVPVAAVLVDNTTGEILHKGHNWTNHSLNGTAHAEFRIYEQLRDAHRETHLHIWANATLYVTVEPCIMCASMLEQVGVSCVVFGCPNERFGGHGSVFDVRGAKLQVVVPGVCHREAVALLRRFYVRENIESPNAIEKKKRVLNLDEFPRIKYSKYISEEDFVSVWGAEFRFVFERDEFLEFDESGRLVNENEGGDCKRLKSITTTRLC